MRFFILSAAAAAMFAVPVSAHPDRETPRSVPKASKTADTIVMPSKKEIHDAIDKLPDLNALMGDLMDLAKDSDLPKKMEKSGDKVKKQLDKSGALEPDRNGLPDIKMTLKILTGALADEEIREELSETLEGLQGIMEKHMPEDKPQ